MILVREGIGHQTGGDHALIRNRDDRKHGQVEQLNRIDAEWEKGQPLEPVQMSNILVDRAVPVEKHRRPHTSPSVFDRASVPATARNTRSSEMRVIQR